MIEFLKGWRRKTGLVTLVLLMVFVFWWARSLFVTDVICLRERNKFLNTYLLEVITLFDSDYVNFFASDGSSMLWIRKRSRDLNEPLYSRYAASGDVLERIIPQWDTSNPVAVVYIPYPAIVCPLTLVSLWLLLSKPSKKNPIKTNQPTSNEVM